MQPEEHPQTGSPMSKKQQLQQDTQNRRPTL
jgi:hypothetical protein